MADIAAGGRVPVPTVKVSGRRRAAGIYGAIVTAAILDVAGGKLSTDALVVAVVATLVVYWLAGLSGFAAANVGLVTAVVVLMVHAWAAGRSARLRGRQLLVTTSIAAGLGLAMILLKDLVLIHLH